MPKIIPNAKELILSESKKILVENGFDALSMKAVAEKCGISAGTVYKYYRNNNELAEETMFNDWCLLTRRMIKISETCETLPDGFEKIYDTIIEYENIYTVPLRIFSDGFGNYSLPAKHHNRFVRQFADIVCTLFSRFGRNELLPDATLYAEILLSSVSRSDISKSAFMKLAGKL